MQGKVCTKYCLTSEETTFCQPRLIILPFNWGDVNPEKITLDDRKASSNMKVNHYSELTKAQREQSRRFRSRPNKEVRARFFFFFNFKIFFSLYSGEVQPIHPIY